PVMAMFMVFLELSHHSYDGYITATHVARERAWSSATIGSLTGQCPAGRDDNSYWSKAKYITGMSGSSGGSQEGTSGAPNPGHGVSAPAGVPGQNGFFKHTADATASMHIDRGGHIWDTTAKSTVSVYCNQKWYGGIVDIIKSAFHR
ncbi:MAG: hypothetical protein ABI551_26000, partial [Polyangiaceae bacterium]